MPLVLLVLVQHRVLQVLHVCRLQAYALLAHPTSKTSFSSFRDSRLISSSSASAMMLLFWDADYAQS